MRLFGTGEDRGIAAVNMKKTVGLLILLIASTFAVEVFKSDNNVVAQSSSCGIMSYNTPIFASGEASGRYSIAERISAARAIEFFGGPIAREAEGKCQNNAAQQFGHEAQVCSEICSSASTPQMQCTGTARLHGKCDPAKCSATESHNGPTQRWGEVWEGTSGKINCKSTGRFTVACVCSGIPRVPG